jgi:hypothetical protein
VQVVGVVDALNCCAMLCLPWEQSIALAGIDSARLMTEESHKDTANHQVCPSFIPLAAAVVTQVKHATKLVV